jgi:hypothetical protein
MKFNCKLVNGLVLGLYQFNYIDLDEWFKHNEDPPENPFDAPSKPMFVLFLGPLQIFFAFN